MKSTERHKLKENEFARSVEHAREMVSNRQNDIAARRGDRLVVIALIGGFTVVAAVAERQGERCARGGARDLRGAGDRADGAGAGQPDAGPAARHLPDRAGEARSGLAEADGGGGSVPDAGRRHRGALLRRHRRWPRSAASRKRSSATRKSSTRPASADLRPNGASRARGRAGRAGQVRPGDQDLPRR